MASVWRQSLLAGSQGGTCWAHTSRHPSRRRRRRGRLVAVFLRPPGALSLGSAAAFGTPLGGLGRNLIERRQAGHRLGAPSFLKERVGKGLGGAYMAGFAMCAMRDLPMNAHIAPFICKGNM